MDRISGGYSSDGTGLSVRRRARHNIGRHLLDLTSETSNMFGATMNSWFNAKPVEVLVMRACDPTLHEPNYAFHLEVAEHINEKKANTCVFHSYTPTRLRLTHTIRPREAAMLIARLVNNRNPHVSILALALLNTVVQSCGYPFHLQISTKEFLNELVRRFPERPPPFPGPVMSRILELIHEWKEGICVDSRWRDDLQNIRDSTLR